jgi:hypothetical protein
MLGFRAARALWEKAFSKLKTNRKALINFLETELDRAAATHPNPGGIEFPGNREYNHARFTP